MVGEVVMRGGAYTRAATGLGCMFVVGSVLACASTPQVTESAAVAADAVPPATAAVSAERNERLASLANESASSQQASARDYRIGPDDLLDIIVFEAEELSRSVRVSGGGEISMPLLGVLPASGKTPREMEGLLVDRLTGEYMVDPQVTVTVTEMQSHPVSVVGAVNQPGVVQIRGSKTLLEVLALANGLAEDAGEKVVVMRAEQNVSFASTAGAETSEVVDLTQLLESADPSHNVSVYPGDIVKVQRAGVIYVVGEVARPGSFPLRSSEELTVLRAVALGEGLLPSASKSGAVIIRTMESGAQTEVPLDLGDILAGRAPDLRLQSEDILFVPNSTSRSVARGLANAFMRMITLRAVF